MTDDLVGTTVHVMLEPDLAAVGIFLGYDEHGAVILEDDTGEIHKFLRTGLELIPGPPPDG